jgi:hypothetical protein
MNAQTLLFRIGGPLLMVLGTVGSAFKLLVFGQKNKRKEPCAIYFIATSIVNLLYIYGVIAPTMLSVGFELQVSVQPELYCRLVLYLAF